MVQKSVLITGCSTGIGLASAKAMQARGWHVLATARTAHDLDMLAGQGLTALELELRDAGSIEACAKRALDLTDGHLFALFNNAAYGQPGAVEDLAVDHLREQFEVNFFSWHDLTRRLLPTMISNGAGRIVQCSSVLGLISPPFRGAYNASKFALEALTDAMRAELADTGVKVSLIEPGPIESQFLNHALKALAENIPIERSRHAAGYRERLEQGKVGGRMGFKLGPEAVAKKLIHALESPSPKTRYFVTVPTYLAAAGNRVLPRGMRERVIARA